MIYLDNAATSFPKPPAVIDSMSFAQKYIGANPGRGGHQKTLAAGEAVYSAREAIGEMFNCDSERVVFTANCTMSLNIAINGIAKKGDHFIISSLEHNSVLRPIHALKEKGIITYDVCYVTPQNTQETINNFKRLVRGNTRAIVCTFASNVFGTVLPVKEIGELCRRKNIKFILDAAQAAGSFAIDMKKYNIDILCAPGHKGLLGPMGTGIMLIGDNTVPEAFIRGGTGSFSMDKRQPDVIPDKFESGTLNFPGIAGLSSGINFIKSFGGEKAVHEKEMKLIRILKEDLSVIKGITSYSSMTAEPSAAILSLNIGDYHSEEIAAALDKNSIAVRAGYHCSYLAHKTYGTDSKGVVRVSPGIFNSEIDIKKLVFYLNKIANSKNI